MKKLILLLALIVLGTVANAQEVTLNSVNRVYYDSKGEPTFRELKKAKIEFYSNKIIIITPDSIRTYQIDSVRTESLMDKKVAYVKARDSKKVKMRIVVAKYYYDEDTWWVGVGYSETNFWVYEGKVRKPKGEKI